MYGIRHEFEKFEDFNVRFNDFDNYDKYDVAILHADEDEVEIARSSNPKIIIGLVKPHHERVVHAPLSRFSLKSLYYQFRFLFGDNKSEFILKRNRNYHDSDFLIADTPYLKSMFEASGHHSLYLKLVEVYDGTAKPLSHKNSMTLVFGYHGNYRHFLESKRYIYPALKDLTKDYKVKLKVISNLADFEMNNEVGLPFEIEFYEYSYPEIYDILDDVDIGLVPNQIKYKNKFFEKVFTKYGAFFWETDKYHDLLFRFKQSSNGGRAFVFSQLAKPFVSCPIPEVLTTYGDAVDDCIAYDAITWKHCIIKLAKNEDLRVSISNSINVINENKISVGIEAKKMKEEIYSHLRRRGNDESSIRT
ncbi:conserved hypothetical protein [Vibrio chagasii]|nr:conserved hypothetical protein [Vibrio chagasii]CAH7427632.1 conserved hypothetical protein [Vibrio chagasii]